MIGRRIGNYEIKAKIGEGGMGAVYLGEHPLIGKKVAVKVLLEELAAKADIVARFFNEAKAVNDIGHSNIVDIVDFGRAPSDNGQEIVYFIMEFLDGESLSARIRRAGLPFKDTLHIMAQCCSGLSASHHKGIVHRDLKPENLFLVPRGNDKNFVKILDFGIAKLTADGGSQSNKTRTGLVIGTPTYMSPEQCEGKGHIDHRSDIYSLGIVMYELLTGKVPFPGEGFGEILVAHLTRQPERPSLVNPSVTLELEAIVLHAVEKDKNRRFQSMDEFLRAVEDPAGHLRGWQPLPDSSAAATLAGHQPPRKSGQTLSLSDGPGPVGASGAPRNTTLEGAAAQVVGGQPRPRSRAPMYVAVAAVAVAAIAGGVVGVNKLSAHGGDTPAATVQAPTPAPQPVPAPAATTVTVTVVSDPPGAKVIRADQGEATAQTAPVVYKLKKGDPEFDIQLKLDGYQAQTRTVTSDESVKMVVSLAKLAEVAPRTETPVTPPTKVKSPGVSNPGGKRPGGKPGPDRGPKPGKKPDIDPDNIIPPSFDN